MPSAGPFYPNTVIDDNSNGGAVAWSSVYNVQTSDNSYAQVNLSVGVTPSDYIKMTNFGFAIPNGVTILGIEVNIEKKASHASGILDDEIKLVKGGVVQSTNKASGSLWSTTDAVSTYGGSNDLWSTTWSVADINDSNFGVVLSAKWNASSSPSASVDLVTITVYYSTAATVINFTGFELGPESTFDLAQDVLIGGDSGATEIQITTKRSGAYGFKVTPNTTQVGYAIFGNVGSNREFPSLDASEIYIRFYFQYTTKPASNSEEILQCIGTTSSTKFALRINSSGNLMAFASDGTTQIGSTGSTALSASVWYRIECHIGTSASFEVRLNGATEISGTGNLSTQNAYLFYIGKAVNRNSQTIQVYYDDILVTTGNWGGEGFIEAAPANSMGTYNDWVGSYYSVKEIPSDLDGTYAYISNNVIGDTKSFSVGISDVTSNNASGIVTAVKSYSVTHYTGGTTTPTVRLFVLSDYADSESFSDDFDVYLDTYHYIEGLHLPGVAPFSGIIFYPAIVNNMEVGITALTPLPTGSNEIRVSNMGLMINYDTSGVHVSLNRTRLRASPKTLSLNNVREVLRVKRLRKIKRSLSIVSHNTLPISKSRLKITAKQAGLLQLAVLDVSRLRNNIRSVSQMSVAIAVLSRSRLKLIPKSVINAGLSTYPCTGQIPLFIQGDSSKTLSNSIPLYLNCISSTYSGVYNSIPLSLTGVTATSSGNIPLYIKGANGLASGTIPLYISGPITSGSVTGKIPMFVHCDWPNRRIPLYIRGSGLTPNSPDGAIPVTNTIPLYLHCPGAEIHLPLYLKTVEGTPSGMISLYTTGITGTASSGLPLYTKGYNTINNRIYLFTKGF
jgi:hypothetical protein